MIEWNQYRGLDLEKFKSMMRGDAVQVLEGPFKGLTCVFQMATAEDRALLLIDLLGRQNTLDVAMATIAAAP